MNGVLHGYKLIIALVVSVIVAACGIWVYMFYFGSDEASASSEPVINEVLCSNSASFKAYDGRFYDWIELYNPSSTEISLDDYYLSDDPEALAKTSLKGQKIPAGGYLVIYCSGLNLTDEFGYLHTNFKLSAADGETLYLASGTQVNSLTVPPSKENVSYGLNDKNEYAWFDVPTPGTENGDTQTVQQFEVRINEYMISNTFTIYDCEGDFGDWIELYNTSDKDVDLSGFALSDEEGAADKYVFPNETVIKANAFMLVFCDGKNKTDSNGILHTNFSLSAKDGNLFMFSRSKKLVGSVAIRDTQANISCGWDEESGEYRFYTRPTPGKANTTTAFQKLSEAEEPSPQGDIIITEVLSASSNLSGKFKKDFIELFNTSGGTVSLKGYTLSKKPGERNYTFPDVKMKAGEYLVLYCDGKARVADKVLYSSVKLGTGGETLYLADAFGVVCDVFSTGKGRAGVSSGRPAGSTATRCFFTSPTPGAANADTAYSGFAPTPAFSADGGVIKSGTKISLSVSGDYTIVYTTDGSLPVPSSEIYDSPITVKENTVIRAAAFSKDKLMSDVVTNTYITENPHTIPIFCISGSPSHLTAGKGVFVNESSSSEYEVYAEYISEKGVKDVQFPCGVKLFGHSSRKMPQKGVKLCLREIYGVNKITYPFFSDNEKAATTFSTLLLRPSGEDQIFSKLRDELIPALLRGKMDLDFEEFRPCALYINGKYWGFYYIREALNADYLESYYGYQKGEYDLIKGQSVVQEGSLAAYKKLTKFCQNNDLSEAENYEEVKQSVDFDSLINFWIVETYFGNTDTVNIRCYKHRDGKWRWMVYDMDWSMQTTQYIRNSNFIDWHLLNPNGHGIGSFDNSIIRKLLQNQEFRDYFLTLYCYHINNTFAPERSLPIFDKMVSQVDGEIKLNAKRWGVPSYSKWSKTEVPYLRDYLNDRPAEMKKALMKSFQLSEDDWAHYEELAENYHPEDNIVK